MGGIANDSGAAREGREEASPMGVGKDR